MPSPENPNATFKEYPEPEFPSEKARVAYRRVKEAIKRAWKLWVEVGVEPSLENQLVGLGLTALPPEIGQLTALTGLRLHNNQLTALPPEIGQLTALKVLDLSDNRLTALPSEIGQLKELRILALSNNQLTKLPPEIGQLTALAILSLSDNQLRVLPPEIGGLTALILFSISHNQLKSLPVEIGRFWALTMLELSDNELTSLPNEIGQLTELTELFLSHNQLAVLPLEIRRLTKLQVLYLHGNDALGLPPEVLGKTFEQTGPKHEGAAEPRAILDHYFERQEQGGWPLNEVRLVLVGRGGAGKTSLVQRLLLNQFNPQEDSTPGIALRDWTPAGCAGAPVTVHVWDFAGQVITHSMHRYFLSHRTVYMLVLTAREDSAEEDAEYWLRLIQSYGSDKVAGSGPPVLVALNKSDTATVKLDRGALRERFPFIAGFVETDCASGRGIEALRGAFCEVLAREDVAKWVREGYPAQWWRLKERLREKQQTQPHLTYEEFTTLCEECGVPDARQAGVSLHTMGLALNYGLDPRWKEVLADTTVLSPSWVTHNCYNLIRHAETHAGLLYRAELESVLSPARGGMKGEPDPALHLYLMRLMERFEVAYPLGDEWPPAQWLVPLGLPDSQPQDRGVEAFGKLLPAEAARLRYTYPGVPPGLIAQFIVRLHPLVEEGMQWAKGTVVALNGARALVRAVSKTEVEVTAMGADKEARRDLAGLCRENLLTLHKQIGGMDVKETTEVEAEGEVVWVSVKTLEKDEQKGRTQTAVATEEGSVLVATEKELDEFGTKAARLAPASRHPGRLEISIPIGFPESTTAEEKLQYVRDHPGLNLRVSAPRCPSLFISYSHKDERLRKTLELYLEVLKIQGLVHAVWHDRRIQPGMDWDAEIARQLKAADVVLLLVSTAFLASDYIQTEELRPALQRHREGTARVIPIILERCSWLDTFAAVPPLSELPEPKRRVPQGIPRDGKTIRSFSPQTDGWHVVQEELKKVLTEVKAGLK